MVIEDVLLGQKYPINIHEIMDQIPHRFPFLLVDRVLEAQPGTSIVAKKNVTINEPFFVGHFPQMPVMPGVLIIEALAQTSGILLVLTYGPRKVNELYFFASIDKVKFKRQVIPGDTLIFEVELIRCVRGVSKFKGKAFVDGVMAAEAELMIAKREI